MIAGGLEPLIDALVELRVWRAGKLCFVVLVGLAGGLVGRLGGDKEMESLPVDGALSLVIFGAFMMGFFVTGRGVFLVVALG